MTTILVIEDVESLREEILETLSYEGFDVLGAENGVVGVQMAKTYMPDLIICDIAMPELDGYAATRAIRSEDSKVKNRKIPIVAMTANAMAGDREKCIESGMDDYLPKPIRPKDLSGMLKKWLNE